ncbi:MAG: hypothetical protein ABR878_18775, partial [Roseiarcus sp.]
MSGNANQGMSPPHHSGTRRLGVCPLSNRAKDVIGRHFHPAGGSPQSAGTRTPVILCLKHAPLRVRDHPAWIARRAKRGETSCRDDCRQLEDRRIFQSLGPAAAELPDHRAQNAGGRRWERFEPVASLVAESLGARAPAFRIEAIGRGGEHVEQVV